MAISPYPWSTTQIHLRPLIFTVLNYLQICLTLTLNPRPPDNFDSCRIHDRIRKRETARYSNTTEPERIRQRTGLNERYGGNRNKGKIPVPRWNTGLILLLYVVIHVVHDTFNLVLWCAFCENNWFSLQCLFWGPGCLKIMWSLVFFLNLNLDLVKSLVTLIEVFTK